MNQDNTKSDEIDVLALLHKLWTKKLLILFTAFYFAAFSFLGTYFFIQPTYTSTTRIYVVNQATDNNNLSAQDLQAGTYLANDYKEIITSNDVLSEVIKDEKLNLSEAELSKMVSVNIPTDTRLISISVNAKTGQVASDMHNLGPRPPFMKDAYEIVKKNYGPKRAKNLFIENPKTLLENQYL